MYLKVSKDLEVSYIDNIENRDSLVLVNAKTFEGKEIKVLTSKRFGGNYQAKINIVSSIAVDMTGRTPMIGDAIFVRATGSTEHYLNIKQIDYLNEFIGIIKEALINENQEDMISKIEKFLNR